jgi:hypothetical protein
VLPIPPPILRLNPPQFNGCMQARPQDAGNFLRVPERFRAKHAPDSIREWMPVRVKKTRQNQKSGASVLIQSEPKL